MGDVGAISAAPVEAFAVVQYADGDYHGLYNATTDALTPLGLFYAAPLGLVFFVITYYGVKWLRNTNAWITTIKDRGGIEIITPCNDY